MNITKIKSLRQKIIHNSLTSIYFAGSGHPGGVLSSLDIILSLFLIEIGTYKKKFNKNRFVLSKGHSAPALYAVAKEFGYLNRIDLKNLRKIIHSKIHVNITVAISQEIQYTYLKQIIYI